MSVALLTIPNELNLFCGTMTTKRVWLNGNNPQCLSGGTFTDNIPSSSTGTLVFRNVNTTGTYNAASGIFNTPIAETFNVTVNYIGSSLTFTPGQLTLRVHKTGSIIASVPLTYPDQLTEKAVTLTTITSMTPSDVLFIGYTNTGGGIAPTGAGFILTITPV